MVHPREIVYIFKQNFFFFDELPCIDIILLNTPLWIFRVINATSDNQLVLHIYQNSEFLFYLPVSKILAHMSLIHLQFKTMNHMGHVTRFQPSGFFYKRLTSLRIKIH